MFDKLDFEIIKLLNEDGRRSASDIARLLDGNERTIRKRIDRLIETEAIRPIAVVNPAAFNYQTSADIFIEIDAEHERQVLAELATFQEISYIALEIGSHDISVQARFKTNGDLYDFVREKLGRMEGVTVSRYVLVPKILKDAYDWLPHPDDFSV